MTSNTSPEAFNRTETLGQQEGYWGTDLQTFTQMMQLL